MSHRNFHTGRILVEIKDCLLASQRFPGDRRFLHISRVPQIFCKNTHAVAALLRLASVRVVDAYIKIIFPQIWTRQNAIRADAKMTAAHLLDILRIQFQIILIWIKHQVIISHTVIFFKHNLFHRDTSCPF